MDSNSCDICYRGIKDKVTLECKHELCVACFLEVMRNLSTSSSFKCHMCRRKYNWKNESNEDEHILEDTLSILIRENGENQFLSLPGMNMSKAFEVIVNNRNPIQFIVILETHIDTEELKFLISEFIANNYTSSDIIGSLRNLSDHFINVNSHLESYHDNLIIKKYRSA